MNEKRLADELRSAGFLADHWAELVELDGVAPELRSLLFDSDREEALAEGAFWKKILALDGFSDGQVETLVDSQERAIDVGHADESTLAILYCAALTMEGSPGELPPSNKQRTAHVDDEISAEQKERLLDLAVGSRDRLFEMLGNRGDQKLEQMVRAVFALQIDRTHRTSGDYGRAIGRPAGTVRSWLANDSRVWRFFYEVGRVVSDDLVRVDEAPEGLKPLRDEMERAIKGRRALAMLFEFEESGEWDDDPFFWICATHILLEHGHVKQAVDSGAKAVAYAECPRVRAWAHNVWGQALWEDKPKETGCKLAEKQFLRAVEADRSTHFAHANLILLYHSLGRHGAFDHWAATLEEDAPQMDTALLGKGVEFFDSPRFLNANERKAFSKMMKTLRNLTGRVSAKAIALVPALAVLLENGINGTGPFAF